MKLKRTVLLATFVVTMGLLLGLGGVQAQTLERDGDTVTAIRGLEIGSFVYDVTFTFDVGQYNYDYSAEFGADFDFTTQEDAANAVDVVNSVLTAEGALFVGGSSNPDLEFNVGYKTKDVTIEIFDFSFIFVVGGKTDPATQGTWKSGPPRVLDLDDFATLGQLHCRGPHRDRQSATVGRCQRSLHGHRRRVHRFRQHGFQRPGRQHCVLRLGLR